MTRTDARAALERLLQPDTDPSLTDDEVDALLDDAQRARVWEPSTSYNIGDRVFPLTGNGHWYMLDAYASRTPEGATGPQEPRWPRATRYPYFYGVVRDGDVFWRDLGPAPSSLWDVKAAARAGWITKAAKAAERVNSKEGDTSYAEQQVYDHCIRMARSFETVEAS
jgi:hypothetical protein